MKDNFISLQNNIKLIIQRNMAPNISSKNLYYALKEKLQANVHYYQ